jgi:transcriptional regulator with XRE-family HTH domain
LAGTLACGPGRAITDAEPPTRPGCDGSEDVFDVVLASMPGYGFPARPQGAGDDTIAAALNALIVGARSQANEQSGTDLADEKARTDVRAFVAGGLDVAEPNRVLAAQVLAVTVTAIRRQVSRPSVAAASVMSSRCVWAMGVHGVGRRLWAFSPSHGYSNSCYNPVMPSRGEVLREVMLETGITQSELSRVSGVRQPSISQYLSGRGHLSDDMLDRLLSCMGYRLEIVRRPVRQELDRSSKRSWELHRRLSIHLTPATLSEWRPIMLRNLQRLRERTRGQPHLRNLDRWQRLIQDGDLPSLRRVMTGLDTDSVEMREVSPMGGLLSQEERSEVLGLVS